MPALITLLSQIFTSLRQGAHYQLPLGRMTGAQFLRLCALLNWTRRRLFPALLHAAAGKPPRPYRPQHDRPRPDRTPATDPHPTQAQPHRWNDPLPRRESWLLPLMPNTPPCLHTAAGFGADLRQALQDPRMAPLLSHPSVIRALRPICRMLGISNALPPNPPRPPHVERISEASAAADPAPPGVPEPAPP